ncbi:MAG: PAS domain S-box protein [Candidatus Omnitrophota bacterium]
MKPKDFFSSKKKPSRKISACDQEALETLRAIREGEVDAFVISGKGGDKVFALESADYPYRLFLDEMDQGAVTITPESVILYCNKSMSVMLGESSGQLTGRSLVDFIAPSDKKVFEELLSGRLQSTQVYLKVKGEELPVYLTSRPLDMGRLKCLCLVITDMEQRKYCSIVNLQAEMIVRWREGCLLTFANDAFCRYFKKTRKMIKDQNFLEWLPRQGALSLRKSLEKAGQAAKGVEWELKLSSRKYSRWSQWTIRALRDENGNIVEFQASGRDITERRMNEMRLMDKEARLRKMVESAVVGIGFGNSTGRILECNEAFLEMTGYSRQEILGGVNWEQLTPAEYEALDKKVLRDLKTAGSAGPYEKEYIRKDGGRVPVLVSASRFPYRDEHVVFVQDMSAFKKTQKKLQESETRYRSLAENMPAVFMRFDRSLRIVYISPLVKEATGLAPEKFLGKTNKEVGHAPGPLLERWESAIEEVFRTGEKRSLEFDYPADWGVKTFHLRLAPEYDGRGNVEYVLGISTDVTENRKYMKLLEEARESLKVQVKERTKDLLRMNEVLEKIFSVENFLIAYLDAGFNYIRVNDAYARGADMAPEFFPHKHHFLLYPSKEQEEVFLNVVKNKETYRAFSQPMPFLEAEAQGHSYWDWTLQPVRNIAGDVEGLIFILVNVTDRKKAELRLMAAQQELDEARHLSDIGLLASTVAHELRNPLAAINVAVGNIKRKAGRQRVFEPQIRTIEKKTAESDQIINNLLFYSRINSARREKLNLRDILEECVEVSGGNNRNRVLVIKKYESLRGVEFYADPVQMRELFFNILHNAYDAMVDKAGRLEIEGAREGEFVKVRVRDNGVGIQAQDLKDVGRPFFTTKAKGTGLGLSVCSQIINLHKGNLEIESQFGEGTTVSLSFPLETAQDASVVSAQDFS